jgi:hypothetical protein
MADEISKFLLNQFIEMHTWVNMYIDPLTDDELKLEFAEGKSHGIWILGHLIVSDDDFSLYMGKGDLLFPEYYEIFGAKSKIQPVESYAPATLLRKQWKEVVEKNKKIYAELTDEELKQPHAKIEDFENDFFKTKENIARFWQLHQMYHAGQLSVLVSRAGKSAY